MQTYKVERKPLERALKYQNNSSTAQMLREAAIQRGGLTYNDEAATKGFVPDCDTQFIPSLGQIRQDFGNGLLLVISTESQVAKVCMDGKEIAAFTDMTILKWGRVVYAIQMIYNKLNS